MDLVSLPNSPPRWDLTWELLIPPLKKRVSPGTELDWSLPETGLSPLAPKVSDWEGRVQGLPNTSATWGSGDAPIPT